MEKKLENLFCDLRGDVYQFYIPDSFHQQIVTKLLLQAVFRGR